MKNVLAVPIAFTLAAGFLAYTPAAKAQRDRAVPQYSSSVDPGDYAPADPVQPAAQQQPPATPEPVLPDSEWLRIQQLRHGQRILVSTSFRPPVRCRFTGATDAYLFCSPTRDREDRGFQFERLSITQVDIDRYRDPINWHPGWITATIAGGLIVGSIANSATDAGNAAKAGLIGAGCTALLGAPLALLPHEPDPWHYALPQGGVRFGVRIPLRQPRFRIRVR